MGASAFKRPTKTTTTTFDTSTAATTTFTITSDGKTTTTTRQGNGQNFVTVQQTAAQSVNMLDNPQFQAMRQTLMQDMNTPQFQSLHRQMMQAVGNPQRLYQLQQQYASSLQSRMQNQRQMPVAVPVGRATARPVARPVARASGTGGPPPPPPPSGGLNSGAVTGTKADPVFENDAPPPAYEQKSGAETDTKRKQAVRFVRETNFSCGAPMEKWSVDDVVAFVKDVGYRTNSQDVWNQYAEALQDENIDGAQLIKLASPDAGVTLGFVEADAITLAAAIDSFVAKNVY